MSVDLSIEKLACAEPRSEQGGQPVTLFFIVIAAIESDNELEYLVICLEIASMGFEYRFLG